jgi:glycerol kinase
MNWILSLDAGTTGVRALAIEKDTAHLIASSYREISLYFPNSDWVEQDADEIWEKLDECIKELLDELKSQPECVGITNQRETVVVWDKTSGKPKRRAIVWQDKRTSERSRQLQVYNEDFKEKTGLISDPYFSATKLEWLVKNGLKMPFSFGTVDSWVVFKLTGGDLNACHITDPSNASRTLLYNIRTNAWDSELLGLFSVPDECLPQVVPSCGHLGFTRLKHLDGVPISGILGDQQSALFGQGCFEPNSAKVTYGTGTFILINAGNAFIKPPEGLLTTVAWQIGDTTSYAIEGSILASGAMIQWIRDSLGYIEKASDFEALVNLADSSSGIYFVPAFAGLGSPWWNPGARGTLIGLTAGINKSHVARAALEAIAYQVQDVLVAIGSASPIKASELKADGKAATMNTLMSFQADLSQVPVKRPKNLEATAMGAAYIAMLGNGIIRDLESINNLIGEFDTFYPRNDSQASIGYSGWKNAVKKSFDWI